MSGLISEGNISFSTAILYSIMDYLIYFPTVILQLNHIWGEQIENWVTQEDGIWILQKDTWKFALRKSPEMQIFFLNSILPKGQEKFSQFTKVFFKDQLLMKLLSKVATLILNNYSWNFGHDPWEMFEEKRLHRALWNHPRGVFSMGFKMYPIYRSG